MRQRHVSPHTIVSYRETFRQLLRFAQDRLKKPPVQMALDDLDAPLIGAFLDHAEKTRGVSARSRNVRLAAIRSFFRYVALEEPRKSGVVQRVLAMPNKKFEKRQVNYLTRPEVEALLAAPDRHTWSGRRDYALLVVAVQTGLRCSELAGLRIEDVELGRGPHLRCRGKGRKERCTPLRRETVALLRSWLRERRGPPSDPVFPSARGKHLSIAGIEYAVRKHVTAARVRCASLRRKRVSPHCLRHTLAMELLQSGVDRSVIALWLGHESPETTQIYLEADMALKEKALSRTAPFHTSPGRYRAPDRLLEFLKNL
jgi:site-specific recombinase XerD